MKWKRKAGKARVLCQWLKQQTLRRIDIGLFFLAAACLYYAVHNSYQLDGSFRTVVPLEAPWLVKSDATGNQYIVDREKSRILQVEKGKVNGIIKGSGADGDSFQSAENICVAPDGTIYVLDTGWSEDGFSIAYESIVKYEGKTKRTGKQCYQVDYTGSNYDKHRIYGMELFEDSIYFISSQEGGFSLDVLNTETFYHERLNSWTFENAVNLVQDFVIDVNDLSVFVIDKRGMLLRAAPGNPKPELLHRMDQSIQEKTVFYRGAAGGEQTVYITDIASDRLLEFKKENDYRPRTLLSGEKMWNVSYMERWGENPKLYYVSGNQVCIYGQDGDRAESWTQYQKTNTFMFRELLLYFILAVGILSLLYLVMRLLLVVTTLHFSMSQKVGALVIMTVIAVSIILVYGLLGEFKEIYRAELLNKLSMTAQIAASRIEDGELEKIESPGQYMSGDYLRLWGKMSEVVNKKYDYSNDIYCNILRYDGIHGYALAYLDNSIGTYYPLTAEETKEIKTVYDTGAILQSDAKSETGSYIYVLMPILDGRGAVTGVVSVGTLSSVIDGKLIHMSRIVTIAIIMIILTIMFLFTETLSFFDLRDKYRIAVKDNPGVTPMHVVRSIVFITFMAFNMATSFLPVYILKFVNPGSGLPAAVANSLPITVNLIIVGVTSVLCPKVLKRVNVSTLAAASSGISLLGDLVLACSNSYQTVMLGMICNGIGVGFITNSLHIYLASVSGKKENWNGFSIFNAASLSGVNCGMLFGSALAERMGQNSVFMVSAVVWALTALVFLMIGKKLVMSNKRKGRQKGRLPAVKFFTSPGILKFIFCIQLPYIVVNSFTYYYVPIFGASQGYSENITSLLIIVSSLCTAYLSVAATNCITKKYKDRSLYLSTVITFAGLMIFAWKMNMAFLLVALVLIGIANSFGSSVRISQFIEKNESRQYGKENAMGVYNLIDNFGESGGSLIFAGILTIGFQVGIMGLMTAVAGLNALYALNNRKKKADKALEGAR